MLPIQTLKLKARSLACHGLGVTSLLTGFGLATFSAKFRVPSLEIAGAGLFAMGGPWAGLAYVYGHRANQMAVVEREAMQKSMDTFLRNLARYAESQEEATTLPERDGHGE
jgi:hypothetical protein